MPLQPDIGDILVVVPNLAELQPNYGNVYWDENWIRPGDIAIVVAVFFSGNIDVMVRNVRQCWEPYNFIPAPGKKRMEAMLQGRCEVV